MMLSLWIFFVLMLNSLLYIIGKKEGENKPNRVRSDVYGKMSP